MALRELEHFFLYTMLREMRKTVPENSLFEKGSSMNVYQDMFDDAIAGHMADSGQFGLAKVIQEQLRVQELQKQVHGAQDSGSNTALNTEHSVPSTKH